MKSTILSNRPAGAFIGTKNAGSIEASGFGTSVLDAASDSKPEIASISTVIDGDSLGKLLPLCQVTGTE